MVISYLLLYYLVLPQLFIVLYIKKNLLNLLTGGNYLFRLKYVNRNNYISAVFLVELAKNSFFRIWSIWIKYDYLTSLIYRKLLLILESVEQYFLFEYDLNNFSVFTVLNFSLVLDTLVLNYRNLLLK